MHQELAELAVRFGKPLEVTRHLGTNTYLAVSRTRVAEICLVFRQPGGRILTISQPFYPAGVCRLPTIGIEPGESILGALERNSWKEIGHKAQIQRYLAHITYQHNEGRLFHSYVFLLTTDQTPSTPNYRESMGGFREVNPSDLPEIARKLEQLPTDFSPELEATWSDWGRFRAVVHQVAAQALVQS